MLPQAQGNLNRNNVAALIREIVDLFLHELLLGGKRCRQGWTESPAAVAGAPQNPAMPCVQVNVS